MMTQENNLIKMYANWAQTQVLLVDANKIFAEWGRGAGKTHILGPRSIRVAASMPRETAAFAHRTYVALFSNIIPDLLEYYRTPWGPNKEPILKEGIDYVFGEKNLPKHFAQPRYPILHPEHTIIYQNGFNIRLVATDQADSIAGANIVHAFLEEMKHSKGDKLRSRIFPALRVGRLSDGVLQTAKSPYFRGITGISDSAMITKGEDNWFNEYEKKVDKQLVEDIISLSLHVNEAICNIHKGKDIAKNQKVINRNLPLLNDMKRECIFYLRVSSFVNRDMLGAEYYQDQFTTMQPSEFLSSICSIRDVTSENSFFELFDEDKHTCEDSYKYKDIMKLTLKDTFKIDVSLLKHYNPSKKILLGYDPGASFASFVVAQEDSNTNTLRIIKEFFAYSPKDASDLAADFAAFFQGTAGNKNIDLYYDRAGNKKSKDAQRNKTTDAMVLKNDLKKYGFQVQLKNEKQRVIFHWEHHRLWKRLLANNERKVPRILIDANECPYLISAIHSCKKIAGSSPVELDKSSERKVALHLQAGMTPQIPSGMMYLAFGLYQRFLPGHHLGSVPSLPDNVTG